MAEPTWPDDLPTERHFRPFGRTRWRVFTWGTILATFGISLGVTTILPECLDGPDAVVALLVPMGVLVIADLAVLGILLVGFWRFVTLAKPAEEVRRRLAAGQVADAAQELESLCRKARFAPLLHALLVYNRGVAYMKQGDLSRAQSLVVAALRSGWPRSRLSVDSYPLMVGGLAALCALRGDVGAAVVYLSHAREHAPGSLQGVLVPATALVHARMGRFTEAARVVAEGWRAAEAALPAAEMRLLRIMHAFLMSRAGMNDPTEVQHLLAGARPFPSGELDYLADPWPEFGEFLREHGFISQTRK